jgi:hypothetical protein
MVSTTVTKGAACFSLICVLIITLPLAITSTVLGAIHPGSCDYTDAMGLNAAQWLLGLGISSIIVIVILGACFGIILFEMESCILFGGIGVMVITVLNILFGIAWFVVGGIILFRGDIECIRNGSSHVIYALVLWCISALFTVWECLKNKKQASNDA